MRICVLGGAGYVGSALVPRLVSFGHDVIVADTFWFGEHRTPGAQNWTIDMRKSADLAKVFRGCEVLIHLACVSNDPSFELNSLFGASVNGPDCMQGVLRAAREAGIRRVIYASSSSIYGVSGFERVTEDSPKAPLTDYSRFKLACEDVVRASGFEWTILRPATVCGWAPRLRLDVVVNAMTASALRSGIISVNGPANVRPNIFITDMCRAYEAVLEQDWSRGCTYNVGGQNLTLREIGEQIAGMTGAQCVFKPTNDPRSYRIDSELIRKELNFVPEGTVASAVHSIRQNLWHGQHTVNIERMRSIIRESSI